MLSSEPDRGFEVRSLSALVLAWELPIVFE